MLDELVQLSQRFLEIKNQPYKRYFIQNNKLTQQLSMLIGQRGVGKTTTLIQYLLEHSHYDLLSPTILYIQADHFLMRNTSLYEIAEAFNAQGGQVLAFDEIHKYPNWSLELKSIYDTFPDIKLIASGSSALEIHKGTHDLSRRAVVYHLYGLSFREYLELYYSIDLPVLSLEEMTQDHISLAKKILKVIESTGIKILPHFTDYLKQGYYPYFRDVQDIKVFQMFLEQNLHVTIESDLAAIYPSLTGNSIRKIKQLLSYIVESVPFSPTLNKIRTIVDINDDRTLKTYFKYLEDAGLIQTLTKATQKSSKLEFSEKIYLNNSNQMYALSGNHCNIGTMRETYFLNILSTQHNLSLPANGGFLVDDCYMFEIGGKKKGFQQIKESLNAYLACDDMEIGIGSKIPLWLFGFLY